MPTEKAHGIQIMQMCDCFARSVKIKLIIPWRFNKIKQDPFNYYGIKKKFKIIKLPCLDLVFLGKIGFLIQMITFLISAKIYLLFQQYDILYTREPLAGLFFKNHILELHMLPKKISKFYLRILGKTKLLVVLTNFIKRRLTENGILESKILIAPDGVDLEKFDIKISKEKARKKLNLPLDKKIVLYTGHLYEWKGGTTLLEAARKSEIRNPKSETLFIFVGGVGKDIKNFEQKVQGLSNVMIIGQKPHAEIPYWLKAADVLVLPNSAKEDISKFYTSPMKLFEYMASGVPIIASDLPSIREVLNNETAYMFKAGNSLALANVIEEALSNNVESNRRAENAREKSKKFSWSNRARSILEFITN